MSDPTNPFAALSLIVAPAVLTNDSSILVLSTSNRLARAIDRPRALATQLETPAAMPSRFGALRLKELYASLGAFAGAALTSLLGAAISEARVAALSTTLEFVAVVAGFVGVAGLMLGCVLLLRETRIALRPQNFRARWPSKH